MHKIEYRTELDKETRSFMERGFMEDFGGVQLLVTTDVAHLQGAVAHTAGADIVIAHAWYRPDTWLGRRILAHELAHVVQKRQGSSPRFRRCRTSPSTCRIEAEAHAAAALVAAGGQFACSIADAPDRPRFWGVAGHYYTNYYILLAAGADPQEAERAGYYAQLPDLIAELDAVKVAVGEVTDAATLSHAFNAAQHLQNLAAVHAGLHALSGRYSADETALWKKRLMAYPLPSFKFGLALHGFGDSYAHRKFGDESCMYPVGTGQAFDGTAPDDIFQRQGLYLEYAMALYDVACKKLPTSARASSATVHDCLERVAAKSSTQEQIDQLRQSAKNDTLLELTGYNPPDASSLWGGLFGCFQPRYEIPTLEEIKTIAASWAAGN